MKIEYAAAARRDIQAIEDYTFHHFGSKQLATYMAKVQSGIGLLAENPWLGKAYILLGDDVRGLRVEHHVVLYKVFDTKIMVLRITHKRVRLASTTIH